jgi:pimeloyl-ACP methyl ester carboxylesterase
MNLRWRKLLWMLTALITGCANPVRPTVVPLPRVEDRLVCPEGRRATRLIVMLPGLYDTPQDFVKHGFVQALRERHINADVVIPDLHFAYYETRTIEQRLREDVIQPARAAGYREIWFAGISLGGLGALLYSSQHPDEISGILLLAPYAGTEDVLKEIREAGGARAWAQQSQSTEQQRGIWRWLVARQIRGLDKPLLMIGTGNDDRFLRDQLLLTGLISPVMQFTAEGGHDWPTWLTLWVQMLNSPQLQTYWRDDECRR